MPAADWRKRSVFRRRRLLKRGRRPVLQGISRMIDLLVLASDFIVHTSSSGFRRAGHLSVYNLIKL